LIDFALSAKAETLYDAADFAVKSHHSSYSTLTGFQSAEEHRSHPLFVIMLESLPCFVFRGKFHGRVEMSSRTRGTCLLRKPFNVTLGQQHISGQHALFYS
jgi:hypothetical protein